MKKDNYDLICNYFFMKENKMLILILEKKVLDLDVNSGVLLLFFQ